MSLANYLTLGRSGLRVSPFCLGTMTFGFDWGQWGSSPEDSAAIMDAYFDAGGNFLDTANVYTKGHSEKVIGDHVGRHASRRDRLVIATKFMGNLFPGDPNGGGAGRKSIAAACDESLRRLQTDSIDLYWMHVLDIHTPIEETMRALDDLVRAGKVRYIGFSDVPAWKAAEAQTIAHFRGWSPLIALQIEYSLAERTVENELMPMARELGMGVTPWSPLRGGVLSGKYTRANRETIEPGRGDWVKVHLTDRNMDIVDVLLRVAKEAGATPSQVALAWLRSRPGVASTIIGARTLDQLRDNLKALDLTLSSEHTAALDEVSAVKPIFPHGFIPNTRHNVQGGTTINGVESERWPLAPQNDDERW
jgi:aryl-alcohol dehydrogenase-like predicted oxidoreductase